MIEFWYEFASTYSYPAAMRVQRLALAGEKDGWTGAFTRAVYTANFGEERDITDEDFLRSLVKIVGSDADAAWARANSPEIKDALKAQTDEAIKRGIFGAPSFTVGDELFWGNDRLEDAVAWAESIQQEIVCTPSASIAPKQGGTKDTAAPENICAYFWTVTGPAQIKNVYGDVAGV